MSATGRLASDALPDGEFVLGLDGAACDGHGICLVCCPERVSLDEWGFAVVDREPIRDPATLRQAQRAVRACPAGALRLEVRSRRAESDTIVPRRGPVRDGTTQ